MSKMTRIDLPRARAATRRSTTAMIAALALAGCSSSSSGGFATGDDGGTPATDDATSPANDSGGPQREASSPSGDASSQACGKQVNSGVMFESNGDLACGLNMPCNLKSDTCCVDALATASCKSGHAGCGAGLVAAAFECVQDTDCPSGQVCCGYAQNNAAGSKCQDVSHNGNKCSPAPSSTQGSVQFCQKTCECKDGSECIPQSCNVMAGVPANLTMCGLQSQAPYNCTTR